MTRLISLLAGAALLASSGAALAYPGQQYAGDAKVSLDAARATALKAQPGEVTDQELEREPGGSGLRYSFDVKTPDGVHEVGVDAATGAVLENTREGAHPD
jgi:uncharacterized membrane protein YkoI